MKALLVAAVLSLTALPAQACRLALALALDVSGSVDDREYDLQMKGLAQALGDPDVADALFAIPDAPVAIAVFEWSSSRYQRIVRDWMIVADRSSLDALRQHLEGWRRARAPQATGLGAAMTFGKDLLDAAPPCWSQTLDVSGDGKNNDWPDPKTARDEGLLAGIRINGLVVAPDNDDTGRATVGAGELAAYFAARVIQGADAFVEVAYGFDAYAEAMRRKLLRELETRPVGRLPAPPQPIHTARFGTPPADQ